MYVPLQLYHYDLFILMWSLFLRVLFLEVLSHMVMWRGVHTPTKYVCGAGIWPMLVQCWAASYKCPASIDPALV